MDNYKYYRIRIALAEIYMLESLGQVTKNEQSHASTVNSSAFRTRWMPGDDNPKKNSNL